MFSSFGEKYRENKIDYRTLSKVYGLRFVIVTVGIGGRFSVVSLTLAIGIGRKTSLIC